MLRGLTLGRHAPALAGCTVAIAAMVAPTGAAAQIPPDTGSYSADSVVVSGDLEMRSRIYRDGGNERREMTLDGTEQIVITRPADDVVYVVMPQMNMGFQLPASDSPFGDLSGTFDGLATETVGREAIDGIDATHMRVSGTDAGGAGIDADVWVSDDGIVLRVEGRATYSGVSQETVQFLENIEMGPQDPALFEPPPGIGFLPMDPSLMRHLQGGGGG